MGTAHRNDKGKRLLTPTKVKRIKYMLAFSDEMSRAKICRILHVTHATVEAIARGEYDTTIQEH